MWKRVGLLALMLGGGVAMLHPASASAQEYRDYNRYSSRYRDDVRHYREDERRDRRFEREWRERAREQRREQEWRAREWRHRERWENGWYQAPYAPAARYYEYPY